MWRRHFIKGASGIPLALESIKGQTVPRRGSPRDQMESATSPGTFSPSRLGRLHDSMAGYVERGDVPGVVTLVSRRGDVHVDSIGRRTLGGKDAMRRDTIFRIASMTKPVTAAAAMILVEECRLRLDEPVNRLLPELADRRVLKRIDGPLDDTVAAKRPITLRDLLTFRNPAPVGLHRHHTAFRLLDRRLRGDRRLICHDGKRQTSV